MIMYDMPTIHGPPSTMYPSVGVRPYASRHDVVRRVLHVVMCVLMSATHLWIVSS